MLLHLQLAQENTAIVKGILRLSQALELKAIAEGIETVFQLDKLKALGCEYGQGNLFSKAVDAQKIETFLRVIQG
ncbi:MAG: EAL domain-containing protein [Limnoraphis robusta]|uniref:EAL domain-containing protein n=1 Tax=Limnoraphis robusta CS-951 TaxID=1637645 RepID=A0A0F5YKF2_9CYAN|nr:EAL domain-containing protein [Limnoraphis robusta]KKD39399.1 hypothetical protein WN50_03685 [Limnoraphis robusta CS-951]